MRDYKIDAWGLNALVNYGRDYFLCGCDIVYLNTNERLKGILEHFDFNGKEVLSVLSSSDHPFSAYYLGAKNVDTFDINWATYYAFYLKKWYLMYTHQAILETKSEPLLKALTMCNQNCSEEEEVFKIWKDILTTYFDISNMFRKVGLFNWDLPYRECMQDFIDKIKMHQANFTEMDIFQEIPITKKYDIVILSNILETVYPEDDSNVTLSQNLRKILKNDGIVICSVLNDRYHELKSGPRRKAFQPYFSFELADSVAYNNCLHKEVPLYYTYRKK